jgi:hypothetical protein
MVVIIKEKEYEYISDHPHDWKRSRGDFKFPVTFGFNKCFVKRFNKPTDSISGWALLEKLKGKNAPGLPRVHDIVSTTEREQTINYLFLEFIEGDTLNKLLAEHVEINVEKLTDNLFSAFETINKYGFWFADFFEKNICSDRRGNFYLVDLDSAQPVSRVPHKDMWGDKEYWGLVFDYYTKVLHKEDFQPRQLSGVFLNYLQIIFLILRVKLFYSYVNRDREFSETIVHPSLIDKASPEFRRVFIKALNYDGLEDGGDLVPEIKKLIKKHIIDSFKVVDVDPEPDEPIIELFTIADGELSDNQFIVEHGRQFVLSWRVKNANDIQLYKNDDFYQVIRDHEGELEVVENVYDSDEKETKFELIASKSGQVVSHSVMVRVTQTPPIVETFEVTDYAEKSGNRYVVENNKSFLLYWEVKNAEMVRLYKDRRPVHIEGDEKQIEFTERVFGDEVRTIEFRLDASNNSKTASSSITILVKDSTPETPPPPPPLRPPKVEPIIEFDLEGYERRNGRNDYEVNAGKQYRLIWHVENVTSLGLLRNGKSLQFDADQEFLEVREPNNIVKDATVEYTLVATVGDEIRRLSIRVTAKKRKPVSPNIPFLIVGLVILAIIAFVVVKSVSTKRDNKVDDSKKDSTVKPSIELSVLPLTLNHLSEGDTLKIPGTSLPENDNAIVVKFNDLTEGVVLRQAADGVDVVVPHLNASNASIKVIVNESNLFTIASNVPYTAKPSSTTVETAVKVFPLKGLRLITEGENLTIYGENFPKNPSLIQVTFNDVNASIVSQSVKKVTVEVPKLADPEVVDIEMIVKGKFHFLAEGVKYEGKIVVEPPINNGRISLNSFSQDVITEGETITITGINIPTKTGSVEVIFDGRVLFPISEQTSTVIRARVPTLVLKSGILAVKANGNFIPLPHSLVIYKLKQ